MNPLTLEWIEKAEGDFNTAAREQRARKSPNYDAVCFHAEQCAEKYLKARLQEAGIPFGRTHDLTALLDLALPVEPTWQGLRPQLRALTVYAVDFRYPGSRADKDVARAALRMCRDVRRTVRLSLGLAP